MQSPEEVRQALATRFQRSFRRWFVERGKQDDGWPLAFVVGRPVEQDLIADHARVRDWVRAWERFDEESSVATFTGVSVEWVERVWPRLGRQRVPERLLIDSPDAVAQLVGTGGRWRRACERADRLVVAWPLLACQVVLGRVFDALADLAEDDFDRLLSLLTWVDAHPSSHLYLRQLPVPGLDTKWITARSGVVSDLLRSLRLLRGEPCEGADLRALLGLRRASPRVRVRLLCASLRRQVGGVEDLELPVEQLATLPIGPRTVLIVENLETGIALPDLAGTIVVMKLGLAVPLVSGLRWMDRADCLYWGDIDTFGYEILNRARGAVPHLRSVLMDAGTLLANRSLCVTEPTQVSASDLPLLTPEERDVFTGLRSGRWGERLRLEQERIPWRAALDRLRVEIEVQRSDADGMA